MVRRLGIAGSLAVLCLTVPAASQDQRPDIFRGRVTVVSVDVYPRRGGRIVEGLTADDFDVFEDGKPQKVDTVEFIRSEPITPDADRRDPNTKEEGDALAADPHNRVFVIYLDIYHTSRQASMESRAPLLDFVRRAIGPNDLFAVMTPEMLVGQVVFGRSTDTLEYELTHHQDWGLRDQPITPVGRPDAEAQLETCMTGSSPDSGDALVALYREDLMATSLEELMVRLGALRDERKNVVLISEGWLPLPPQPGLADLGSGRVPTIGTGPNGLGFDRPTDRVGMGQSWCDQQARRLTSIDFDRRFRDLLDQAARANVSFYPVDVGGLRTPTEFQANRTGRDRLGPPRSLDAAVKQLIATVQGPNLTTLRVLADNTEGRAVFNSNDPSIGLRQIAEDLSAYYLLGYSSTNTALDGKYRRIQVKVKQPNVDVSARKGYLAAMPAPSPDPSALPRPVPISVTNELDRLSRLRPGAELFTYAAVRRGAMDIVVELTAAAAARVTAKSGVPVQVLLAGAHGEDATATGRIEQGARSALVRVVLPSSTAGPWRVTVRLPGTDGALTERFDAAMPEDGGTSLAGLPVVYRSDAAGRMAPAPVADFQFRRSDRLRVQWPVQQPLDERSARILDRRGNLLAVPASVALTDDLVNVDVPLASLTEGDYLVELLLARDGRSERKLVAFRVVR
jgi:VWFA-related protein